MKNLKSVDEIVINGTTYIPKVEQKVNNTDGLQCVVVRTYSAGVFYGYLSQKSGMEVELINAKRIWAWYGAASLSQLAMEGVSKPNDCKIPIAVNIITLTQVIEIIPLTKKAFDILEGVPIWQA